jgi:A/G-specific adenine glycosylase
MTRGLLGGMLCFPTTKWEESKEATFSPPFKANWHILDDTVYHTFSHFHLELSVAYGVIDYVPHGYLETPFANFHRKSLPTVMRKVFDVGFKTESQKPSLNK